MIDLEQIKPGDQVWARDAGGNRLEGPAVVDHHGIHLVAFSTKIMLARRARTGSLLGTGGIKITAHQPDLFGGKK